MGLTDTADAGQGRPIDKFCFPDVVRDILKVVNQLFHDSHKIRDKYGCRRATSEDIFLLDADKSWPISNLAASSSNFSIRSPSPTSKIMQNMVWVIHGRNKWKDLVDSLQGVTNHLSLNIREG